MITQSGPICDVCGLYIISGKSINPFSMQGIEGTLCCHDGCKPKVLAAMDAKRWQLLPSGPIRSLFEANSEPEASGDE